MSEPTPDGEVLVQWVIYDHPSDYPQHYVVRVLGIFSGGVQFSPEVWLRPNLDQARDVITANAPGLCRLEPSSIDHPSIVEVWT